MMRRLPSFDPRDIASLAVWLDAQDQGTLTFNSTTISSWRNKGTAGVGDAVQATTIRQPLYVAGAINSKPALWGFHDGTNASQLRIADHAGLNYTNFTAFVVAQRSSDSGIQEQLAGKYISTGNNREHRFILTAADQASIFASVDGISATAATITAPTFAVSTPYIIDAFQDGAIMSVALNARGATTGAKTSVFNGTGDYTIFSFDTFLDPYKGYIGEYLFFTSLLSANNRSKVIRYLSAKWGIIL